MLMLKTIQIYFKALRFFWYICHNVLFIGLVIRLQTLLAFLAESDHLSRCVSSSITNPDHRGTMVTLRLRIALLWCIRGAPWKVNAAVPINTFVFPFCRGTWAHAGTKQGKV